jgi:hypothetical protein
MSMLRFQKRCKARQPEEVAVLVECLECENHGTRNFSYVCGTKSDLDGLQLPRYIDWAHFVGCIGGR